MKREPRAPKAERLAQVVDAEGARNRSIGRQVAMKCAADVVVAVVNKDDSGNVEAGLQLLIDAVLERFLDKVE